MTSWAIKAIEDAALSRALGIVSAGRGEARMCGFTAAQVMSLAGFYRNRMGIEPEFEADGSFRRDSPRRHVDGDRFPPLVMENA
jgi:hypothetical protein